MLGLMAMKRPATIAPTVLPRIVSTPFEAGSSQHLVPIFIPHQLFGVRAATLSRSFHLRTTKAVELSCYVVRQRYYDRAQCDHIETGRIAAHLSGVCQRFLKTSFLLPDWRCAL
jgi:hypothetical protein